MMSETEASSSPAYNDLLARSIEEWFQYYIFAEDFLIVIKKYDRFFEVLSKQNIAQLQQLIDSKSKTPEAINSILLDYLKKGHPKWFDIVLDILRDTDLNRNFVAELLVQKKSELDLAIREGKVPLQGLDIPRTSQGSQEEQQRGHTSEGMRHLSTGSENFLPNTRSFLNCSNGLDRVTLESGRAGVSSCDIVFEENLNLVTGTEAAPFGDCAGSNDQHGMDHVASLPVFFSLTDEQTEVLKVVEDSKESLRKGAFGSSNSIGQTTVSCNHYPELPGREEEEEDRSLHCSKKQEEESDRAGVNEDIIGVTFLSGDAEYGGNGDEMMQNLTGVVNVTPDAQVTLDHQVRASVESPCGLLSEESNGETMQLSQALERDRMTENMKLEVGPVLIWEVKEDKRKNPELRSEHDAQVERTGQEDGDFTLSAESGTDMAQPTCIGTEQGMGKFEAGSFPTTTAESLSSTPAAAATKPLMSRQPPVYEINSDSADAATLYSSADESSIDFSENCLPHLAESDSSYLQPSDEMNHSSMAGTVIDAEPKIYKSHHVPSNSNREKIEKDITTVPKGPVYKSHFISRNDIKRPSPQQKITVYKSSHMKRGIV